MRKYILSAFVFFSIICSAVAQDMHARMDSLMGYYKSEYNFNGVALVADKGDLVFEKAYGYKNLSKKDTMDDNALFQVGAITSQFTAEVILMLAKEHKLALSDKISKYFPKFPKGDSITVQNLLSNTSGIMDYFMLDDFLMRYDSVHIKPDSLMAIFDKRRPQGIPGARFQYSNSNYFMLGQIIEKVTHENYAQVFRDMIFRPVGMTHSGFDYRGLKSNEKCLGYRHYGDTAAMPYMDSCVTGAAAGLYASASDLYAWNKALLADKLLDKKMQDSMQRPVIRNYGYGWFADTVYGKIAAVDGGEIRGFSCYLYRIPSENFCIILLQNINFPAVNDLSLSRKIAGAFFDKDFIMPVPAPIINMMPDQLRPYEGTYMFPSGVSVVVSKGDNELHVHNIPLKGEQNKAADFDLHPIGSDQFKTSALSAIVEFKLNDQGIANALIMHNNKHDIIARRKEVKQTEK